LREESETDETPDPLTLVRVIRLCSCMLARATRTLVHVTEQFYMMVPLLSNPGPVLGVGLALPHRVKKKEGGVSKKYKDMPSGIYSVLIRHVRSSYAQQSRTPHTQPSAMRVLSGRTVVIIVLTSVDCAACTNAKNGSSPYPFDD
jgi:hypothetical protein